MEENTNLSSDFKRLQKKINFFIYLFLLKANQYPDNTGIHKSSGSAHASITVLDKP